MSEQTDLLEQVVQELERREGQLRQIALDAGMPYDTVLRIKRRDNDPGYSRVKALHAFLFGASAEKADA